MSTGRSPKSCRSGAGARKYSLGSVTSLRALRSVSPPTAVVSAATVPSVLRIVCRMRNVLPSPRTKSHVTSASSPASSSRRYGMVVSRATGPTPFEISPDCLIPAAWSSTQRACSA